MAPSSSAAEISKNIKELLNDSKTKNNNDKSDAHRLDELRRLFAKLQQSDDLTLLPSSSSSQETTSNKNDPQKQQKKNNNNNEATEKWNEWLNKKHTRYLRQLLDRIKKGKKYALRCYFGVMASSPSSSDGGINEDLMYKLVNHLSSSSSSCLIDDSNGDGGMSKLMSSEFVGVYRDVQYHILKAVGRVADEYCEEIAKKKKKTKVDYDYDDDDDDSGANVVDNLVTVLLMVTTAIADDAEELKNGRFLISPPEVSSSDETVTADEAVETNDETNTPSDSDSDSDSSSSSSPPPPKTTKSPTKQPRSKPTDPSNIPPILSLTHHHSLLSTAWLSTLRLPHLSPPLHRRTLSHLTSHILPRIPHPLLFSSYLTSSYTTSIHKTNNSLLLHSLLSLEALFYLITQHSLEHPPFYSHLYELLTTPALFYSKHRVRFFKLLKNCLMQTQMLPSYLVAAFAKRCLRVSLIAPPSGALFLLALVSNLLRRHEDCRVLYHRRSSSCGKKKKSSTTGGGDEMMMMMTDEYNHETNDPKLARALQSSLWELNVLERHYHPVVAELAKSVGRKEEDEMVEYDLDVFGANTYKSLMEGEMKKSGGGGGGEEKGGRNSKRRKVAVTFKEPSGLFESGDVFDGMLNYPVLGGEV